MKLVALSLLAFSLASCSSSPSSPPSATNSEFVATTTDFSNFNTWTRNGAPRQGIDPAHLLGMGAHGGPDSSVTRIVYMNSTNPQRNLNGQFPTGTIFLKTSSMTSNPDSVLMVTAMAKRGGTYDFTGNGWEFFMLSPKDGTIMERGDTIMNGMCKSCHTSAGAGKDFIFTR